MGRFKNPYVLIKRKTKKGRAIWYYRLAGETTKHSTGESVRYRADEYAREASRKRDAGITLRQYARDFFAWDRCPWIRRQHAKGRPFGVSVAKMRRAHLVNKLFPEFGDQALAELNPVRIEDWLIGLDLSNETKNHLLNTFNIVVKEAVREGHIESNPLDQVERMGTDRARRDTLTLGDVKKLFPADEAELLQVWKYPLWAAMHYLMLTTGMRVGEVAAVEWEDVLWEIPAVVIRRAVKADGSIGLPKSGRPRAALLPGRTRDLLLWWHNLTPYSGEEDLVFCGRDGRQHLNTKTIGRKMPQAVGRTKIELAGRRLTAHCLRHTYNTRMRTLLPESILQYMIGHRSKAMTDHYDQATPEQRIREYLPALKQLDGVWN